MKRQNPKTDLLNHVVYYLSRLWVILILLFFVFIPITNAMASAGAASTYGINAMNYNPAGMANMKGVEFAFSHTNWLMGSRHDFIGVGMPVQQKEGWKAGIGVTRLTNNGIEGRESDRSKSGIYTAYDQSVSIALAKSYGRYDIGASVKYIQSSIAGVQARTYALDLGARKVFGALPLSIGLSVQNIGPGMRYILQKDPLPLSASAGIVFMPIPCAAIALDARRFIYDKYNSFSIGTEYAIIGSREGSALLLRAGMTGGETRDSKSKGFAKSFSTGAGIKMFNMDIDYSLTPSEELGNTQKISLKARY